MRIAYVTETYPPEINGVSLSVERTVGFLRERGHAVELIRPRQPGESARDDSEEWRTAGIPLPLYPDLRLGLAFSCTLAKRFAYSRPDLVHVATEGPLGRAALIGARRRGVPVSTDFRTNFPAYSRHYGAGWLQPAICGYLRNFHNLGQRTFVPSRKMRDELVSHGFLRLDVVGRGVDSTLFSPARRSPQLRAEWGVSADNELVLLYVGRLAREKNIELALRAFNLVRSLLPQTQMIVVGDGPLRTRLEAKFPAARFVGARRGEDLARHYASADLFVFPSESETFGNVTIEAMSSGLAVVGFDAAAVADLIVNGDNGLVAAPGDESAFIGTVCRCAALGSGWLAPLRGRARETALRTSWDKILGHLEQRLIGVASINSLGEQRHVVMA